MAVYMNIVLPPKQLLVRMLPAARRAPMQVPMPHAGLACRPFVVRAQFTCRCHIHARDLSRHSRSAKRFFTHLAEFKGVAEFKDGPGACMWRR